MTEYSEIKSVLAPILENGKIFQVAEALELDDCGSAYSEFSGMGLEYRIEWNGKERCGYIKTYENGAWVNLNATAPEASHNAFEAALFRMRIALVEHRAMKKLNA